jgi:hypothetical protein
MNTSSRFVMLWLATGLVSMADDAPIKAPKPTFEPSWFDGQSAVFSRTETIEIKNRTDDRLLIRYCPIADSGVELDLLRAGTVLWRAHVQPLGVEHSKYRHEVSVVIEDADPTKILVVSIGAKTIHEIRSLLDGRELARIVTKNQK